MSFSIHLMIRSCEHCKHEDQVWSWDGMTYNLAPMFAEAGFYDFLKRRDAVDATPNAEKGSGRHVLFGEGPSFGRGAERSRAFELIPLVRKGLYDMLDNPEKYRAMNPKNGWGQFDTCDNGRCSPDCEPGKCGALGFTKKLLSKLEEFPHAWVEFSG